MDDRLYKDANVAMSPSDTPSRNGDKVFNKSTHKTSSSEQDPKAPTTCQDDPEKSRGLEGLRPDASVERLPHRDSDEEGLAYQSGLKLFILTSVLPIESSQTQPDYTDEISR